MRRAVSSERRGSVDVVLTIVTLVVALAAIAAAVAGVMFLLTH